MVRLYLSYYLSWYLNRNSIYSSGYMYPASQCYVTRHLTRRAKDIHPHLGFRMLRQNIGDLK